MKSALISVVIPAYNHEKYVRQTIRSIMDQDYPDIELLIVDDGSKDNTFSVIQAMRPDCEKRFSRFVCETQPNQGTCATLNRLISMAKGEFIYLIASDDMAKPNAISTLLNEFRSDDVVLAVGDNEFIDGTGTRIGWNAQCESTPWEDARYKTFVGYLRSRKYSAFNEHFGEYATLLQGNYIPNGYLIRKSALEKMKAFTIDAPLEDLYMHLQLSKFGAYRFVDKILFSYRWHGGNAILQKEKMNRFRLKTLRYEAVLVQKYYLEYWPLFSSGTTKEKVCFDFLFCRISKEKNLSQNAKKIFLSLFGMKCMLYCCKIDKEASDV